jgi:NADPH-ferrihemoprotein reductase
MAPSRVVAVGSVLLLIVSLVVLAIVKILRAHGRRACAGCTGPEVAVWFGSQTGTAEGFARSLHSAIESSFGPCELKDIATTNSPADVSSFDFSVFCQATYGDGEPTDDAHWFFDSLDGLPSNSLSGCVVAVFALGNSQYEHFAAAGKKLRKSLLSKGAIEACELGTGDDDGDIDSDFEKWKSQIALPALLSYLNVGANGKDSTNDDCAESLPLEWRVVYADDQEAIIGDNASATTPSTNANDMLVFANEQLCASDTVSRGKSTVHVEVQLPADAPGYAAGDHIAIQPKHSEKHVVELADTIGLERHHLNRTVRLAEASSSLMGEKPFSSWKRLMDAIAEHVELGLAPPRQSLKELANFCSATDDAKRLRDAASSADKWRAQIDSPQLCLREVISTIAPSCTPSLGALFGGATQKLLPRRYSLASSPLADGNMLAISCSVVRSETPNGRLHEGVTSSGLEHVQEGVSIRGTVRRTNFKLPQSCQTPIVLICAGTGVAPFRAFLRERREAAKQGKQQVAMGECLLYFGCRSESECLYKHELEGHLNGGELSHLRLAFSRSSCRREYVQDALSVPDESARVYNAIVRQNGCIYICGDATGMARGAHEALANIISSYGQMTADDAERELRVLSECARYLRDIW